MATVGTTTGLSFDLLNEFIKTLTSIMTSVGLVTIYSAMRFLFVSISSGLTVKLRNSGILEVGLFGFLLALMPLMVGTLEERLLFLLLLLLLNRGICFQETCPTQMKTVQ